MWKLLILVALSFATQDDDIVITADLNNLIGVTYTGQMYSGYLPVNDAGTAQFHYYFYPNPDFGTEYPVILWLNGGPGCSSLQGAVNENGPFVFKAETAEFELNPYSWTKFANMLYIESPIGVGFSYGPSQEQTDDTTAVFNLRALVEFYARFPEYQATKLIISGESYAGIYIPYLADQIVKYNKQPYNPLVQRIRLDGLAIGNGCTSVKECSEEAEAFPIYVFDFYGRHGFVSDELYQQFKVVRDDCYGNKNTTCQNIVKEFTAEISEGQSILYNPYNVYGTCPVYKPDAQEQVKKEKSLFSFRGLTEDEVPPCADVKGLLTWFRKKEFLDVTHIKPESAQWKVCNDVNYGDNIGSYHLYPGLITAGVRILKFSGDVDAVVPITGTLEWINQLQLEYGILIKKYILFLQGLYTINPWRPWFVDSVGDRAEIDGTQNAGNVWNIDGLTFISIKGAGHMVPLDKRYESFVFMQKFVRNEQFP